MPVAHEIHHLPLGTAPGLANDGHTNQGRVDALFPVAPAFPFG